MIREVAGASDVVLIGGQAVAWWAQQLNQRLTPGTPTLELVTSTDLDFQGQRHHLDRAAALLGARVVTPHNPLTTNLIGVASFEAHGVPRAVDFLRRPWGLDADDVAETAIPFELDAPDGGRFAVRVMHPHRVLESRIHNSTLPNKKTPRAARQLLMAIECARAYSDLLMDQDPDRHRRGVLGLNERVFDLALNDRDARALWTTVGVDVFEAVCHHEALPEPFVSRRLPQMRSRLQQRGPHGPAATSPQIPEEYRSAYEAQRTLRDALLSSTPRPLPEGSNTDLPADPSDNRSCPER